MSDEASGLTKREVDSLKREISYWVDQHRLAEKWALDNLHRVRMLTDCLAAHGLLDEAGLRKNYLDVLADRIRVGHDLDHLSLFRRGVASLAFESERARGTVDDTKVLDATLKAMHKSISACFDKDMKVAEAREQAEKILAGIPQDIEEKPEGLFELPGGAS